MSLAQMSERANAAAGVGFGLAAEVMIDVSGAVGAVSKAVKGVGAGAAGPGQVGRPTERGGTLQAVPEGGVPQRPCCCALPHHAGGRWAGSGASEVCRKWAGSTFAAAIAADSLLGCKLAHAHPVKRCAHLSRTAPSWEAAADAPAARAAAVVGVAAAGGHKRCQHCLLIAGAGLKTDTGRTGMA